MNMLRIQFAIHLTFLVRFIVEGTCEQSSKLLKKSNKLSSSASQHAQQFLTTHRCARYSDYSG